MLEMGNFCFLYTMVLCELITLNMDFSSLFIFNFNFLFLTVLGLHCGAGFCLVAASEGWSLVAALGCSLQWLLLLPQALAHGASSVAVLGSKTQAQWLRHMGLVALRHVGSSWIRDQTSVSCIGRQILYH